MADGGGIDRERLIADLTALVRIPSITGSEESVATWAAVALADLGLAVETITPDPAAIRSIMGSGGTRMKLPATTLTGRPWRAATR